MRIKPIMRKECATTATINTVVTKNHGIAHMINSMRQGCARTATSTTTTVKNGKKNKPIITKIKNLRQENLNQNMMMTELFYE